MATITHYCERNAKLIAAGRLDGSPAWVEYLPKLDRRAAERAMRMRYGRAPRVDRSLHYTVFRFVGFMLTVSED